MPADRTSSSHDLVVTGRPRSAPQSHKLVAHIVNNFIDD
ncbi:Uncharacterised protein [Amycolatopsis camponoti]|uniref:Uncharacterized protein n=1 Tax=Amycolatopsis camponoti TaxID=2606593 RepID=A0A6I8LQG0_9PSEU|nr:Uncharacterised protein [Amycolatopsis camponoti]